jgi:Coenzyme PQQ synthesis protein D (PqqD)
MPDLITPDDLLDAHIRLPQHVVHRSFVAETVILNLRTGKYHGLNATAGRILDGLEQGHTPREVAAAIAREYNLGEDEVRVDVVTLCHGLLERSLIEIMGGVEEHE